MHGQNKRRKRTMEGLLAEKVIKVKADVVALLILFSPTRTLCPMALKMAVRRF